MGAAAQGAGRNLRDDEGIRGIGEIDDRQPLVAICNGCNAVGVRNCLSEARRVYLGDDDGIHSHIRIKERYALEPVGDQNHLVRCMDV